MRVIASARELGRICHMQTRRRYLCSNSLHMINVITTFFDSLLEIFVVK